jgi:hypothetical protein
MDRGGLPHEVVSVLAQYVARRGPTVVVLEDLHWADEATLDVLRLLGRRIDAIRALVLATFRDDGRAWVGVARCLRATAAGACCPYRVMRSASTFVTAECAPASHPSPSQSATPSSSASVTERCRRRASRVWRVRGLMVRGRRVLLCVWSGVGRWWRRVAAVSRERSSGDCRGVPGARVCSACRRVGVRVTGDQL